MSRDYIGEKTVVYPVYIDKTLSRRKGRRLSLTHAVSNPTVDEVVRAAELLGLEPVVEERKHPRDVYKYAKVVVVRKKYSKHLTLVNLAMKIKELRKSS
ncbi:MAG: signal recognition particle subunit SRP19/SEC65 family protein [Desulfurococcaceae archaeon]